MKRLVYFIMILILAAACKEVYDDPPQAFAQASTWNSVYLDSTTQHTLTPKITIQGIGPDGKGLDSLWMNQESASVFLIPLSTNDTTNYLMTFDSVTDTVSIIHDATMKYASMETGFYYEYKLKALKYTHNRIDSLIISDSLATINWHENIKFYLHPLSGSGS